MDEQAYHRLISGQSQTAGGRLLRFLLRGASIPYGAAMRLRNRWYDWGGTVHSPGVPVISVGNLTAGGTGKTPMVAWIVQQLQQLGRSPGIISRGYRSPSSTDPGEGNDEKRVLEILCPRVGHIQNRDRIAAARSCLEQHHSDVLVADDAFQHRRLARALDIVLIDATNPWGYGHVHPRGLLREPKSSLRRADLVILTRADQVGDSERELIWDEIEHWTRTRSEDRIEVAFRPTSLIDTDGQRTPIESLAGKKVLAFCGIGNPESFRRTLEASGCEVTGFRTFRDHHIYSREDLQELTAESAKHGACLITTLKDLVKTSLPGSISADLYAVDISPEFRTGSTELTDRLASVFVPATAGSQQALPAP